MVLRCRDGDLAVIVGSSLFAHLKKMKTFVRLKAHHLNSPQRFLHKFGLLKDWGDLNPIAAPAFATPLNRRTSWQNSIANLAI